MNLAKQLERLSVIVSTSMQSFGISVQLNCDKQRSKSRYRKGGLNTLELAQL